MINETKIDSQIAELGKLGDKTAELYSMSVHVHGNGTGQDACAGIDVLLLAALADYHRYWKELCNLNMTEYERGKIKRIVKRIKDKVERTKTTTQKELSR